MMNDRRLANAGAEAKRKTNRNVGPIFLLSPIVGERVGELKIAGPFRV